MKRLPLFAVIISSMLLSSCSLFGIYSSTPKEVNVYDLDEVVGHDGVTLDKASLGTVMPRFIDGEQYIPYFSLEQYAALYTPHFDSNAKSEVTTEGAISSWTIYFNDELYFYAAISPLAKQVALAGSISSTFKKGDDPVDYGTLSHGVEYDDNIIKTKDSTVESYSFKNCSFKTFKKDGVYYYPLGLLDISFSENSGIYFYYNYTNIYETRAPDNFSEEFRVSGNRRTSVNAQMEEVTRGKSIPSYLIDYNAYTFVYLMENFYGLKSTLGISSIRDFYINNGLYKGLFYYDDKERGEAYSRALAVFDDHHTALVSINNAWGEGQTPSYGGTKVMKRQQLNKTLSEMRKDYYANYFHNTHIDMERAEWADNIYSSNNRTVMFFFDSFSYGSMDQVFSGDSIKADAGKYDTYYNVLNHLDSYVRAKEAGKPIENVIIDVSTNGGGTIGVMTKILSLISKDNYSELAIYDEASGIVQTSKCKVDANEDKQYTADETYGNKFNIYLLTSDCSFSCGNAFPCYAQKLGIKTIGEKSGGGECAVSIHYLPNSQYVYHSSLLHIGYHDAQKNAFSGFEKGAIPDYSLVPSGKDSLMEYNSRGEYVSNVPYDFYNIDHLDDLIYYSNAK